MTIVVAAGIIERDHRILATRRKKGSHLELHWEFPGGKLEAHESPEECLARELREELGVTVAPGRILDVVFHRYPESSVLLLFYECTLTDGEPRALDCDAFRWVPRAELPSLEWAPADLEFVAKLAADTPIVPGERPLSQR
ncbi:MAG TPA: (deoxy)nucleoside triphosphate pyrophosphohydrolase [Vicinamibacteria bacterium]|nr:(deoxy)nucleoside triphosphate pyrophosphohydrolase [Vicinamibacteria bacterium]